MRKYCPSNGTEGMGFMESFCERCIHQHPDMSHPKQCDILTKTMCYFVTDDRYPEEWTYDESNRPTCTAWKKWDWGKDDDGNWIEPIETPPDDPNQLCFPFIFDELNIKQIQPKTA